MRHPAWQNRANADIAQALQHRGQAWDVVVIGGGITGAGILLEAAKRGLSAILLEQRDFAWGTSSRSSKLVHGGLRYLKEAKFHLTRDSVRERERLMQQADGLVEAQSFAFADYRGRKPGRWMFALGLAIYDRMAGQRARHYFSKDEFNLLTPHIAQQDLQGGLCYADAKTDDARLVLRVLQEAQAAGAVALNYVAVENVLYSDGQASALEVVDQVSGQRLQIACRTVINATGAWAARLRRPDVVQADSAKKLRPLRGSHLIFPAWRLPVAQAVSLMHPRDGRPVFLYPWEGVTLVGTTDVDHQLDIQQEARISQAELDYLMEALAFQFPSLALSCEDIVSCYAGVRTVIDSGQADPSKEARDHAVWLEHGLLTVTGGKLTTFRLIALDALKQLKPYFPHWKDVGTADALFPDPLSATAMAEVPSGLNAQQWRRLCGRWGRDALALIAIAQEAELQTLPGTQTLVVELRWAARFEAVWHLDDLLLRRTRLGLLLKAGGAAHADLFRRICQQELGWNDARWLQEWTDYLALWEGCYSVQHLRAASSASMTSATSATPVSVQRCDSKI